MVANKHSLYCWFCGSNVSDAELLFISPIGGLPPVICSGCIEGFSTVIKAYRLDPVATAYHIAVHNKAGMRPQITHAPAPAPLR